MSAGGNLVRFVVHFVTSQTPIGRGGSPKANRKTDSSGPLPSQRCSHLTCWSQAPLSDFHSDSQYS